jgi:hypothetical protein
MWVVTLFSFPTVIGSVLPACVPLSVIRNTGSLEELAGSTVTVQGTALPLRDVVA